MEVIRKGSDASFLDLTYEIMVGWRGDGGDTCIYVSEATHVLASKTTHKSGFS